MSSLHVLVEEPSMEEALKHLMPKIVAGRAKWKVINMGSKGRLLKELPARLRAYRQRIENGENLKAIVLVDRDSDDCHELKQRLEIMAYEARLSTKTSPDSSWNFRVVTRIVVEELEAWFMGDTAALQAAFTSLSGRRVPRIFNNPDDGGTWERLHRFLKQNRIYRNSYPKIAAVRKIAPNMEPARNRSKSFQVFLHGVEACL